MEQVTKQASTSSSKRLRKKKTNDKRLPQKPVVKKERKHQEFGTSKAEQDFAKNFLDKLGVRYVWQFKTNTGRFFDYYLPDYNILVEFDGQFFHADDRIYKEEDLTPMQKRNRRIDEEKNRWALLHCIPLIRVKEKDVNEHPEQVMKMLRERLKIQGEIIEKEKNMNKRHVNKLNENKN